MKNEVLDFHAKFCETSSNPKGLEILCLLKSGERSAGDITRKLGVAKANAEMGDAVMKRMEEMELPTAEELLFMLWKEGARCLPVRSTSPFSACQRLTL